jgi:hypothetical protein
VILSCEPDNMDACEGSISLQERGFAFAGPSSGTTDSRRNSEAPVTREGQLLFFAQFLHAGGRWERFVSNAPLYYEGNRGSAVVDLLGTATLSILCGHWRYAHINSVRGDRLNPPLLNMSGTVSEDVVRRAMSRIEEGAGIEWLSGELRACIEPVSSQPWILDIDVTIKPIYERQQGAELGHNPHKAGSAQPSLP